MAIGDTVRAGLMRIDPSAILRAGEEQARVGERIGQTVSGLVGTYVDTKKRRQEDEGRLKGISQTMKTLAQADPANRDIYEATDARINDPEIPLSQRVAEGISTVQNLGVTEKVRGQRQLEAQRGRELAMAEELSALRGDAMKFQTLKDKYMLGQQIKRDDFFPVEQQVDMEIRERQAKLDAQVNNVRSSEVNLANAEFRLKELQDNKDLDRATKEALLEKERKEIEILQLDLDSARRQFDRISGLDATIDLSDEVVPDPNNEIFQLLATMDLNTALQGDLGGMYMRGLSAVQKFLAGGTLAKATEAEGQKIGTVDYLLREPLLKRISSRPTNLTNDKVDEILPKRGDTPPDGKKKIENSLLPALRSQLETAKRTLLSTEESEKPYIADAEKLATELPNIIKGLEIALIDDDDERRSAFSTFFEGGATTQPTIDATNMGTTNTGVRYRVRRTN